MAAVSVTIGAENKTKAGLDAAKSDVRKWKADVDKIANGRGGGGVVLEGDNKVKRSMANITSGLLQANNAGEAVISTLSGLENIFRSSLAGGVAATGMLVLASATMTANGEYEKLTENWKKSVGDIRNVNLFGNAADNMQAFTVIKNQFDELTKAQKQLFTFKGSALSFLGQSVGGDTKEEKLKQIDNRKAYLLELEENTVNRIVELEEKSLEVNKLKAAGKTEEAKKLQDQIALSSELLRIDGMRLNQGSERLKNIKTEQFVQLQLAGMQAKWDKSMGDAWDEMVKTARGKKADEDKEEQRVRELREFEAEQKSKWLAEEEKKKAEAAADAKEVADVADQRAQNRAVKNEQERFEAEQEATSKIGMTGAQEQAMRKNERTLDIGDRRRAAREVEKIDRESRKMGKGALTQEQRANLGAEIVGKLKDQRDGTAEAKHLAAIEKIMNKIDGVIERK